MAYSRAKEKLEELITYKPPHPGVVFVTTPTSKGIDPIRAIEGKPAWKASGVVSVAKKNLSSEFLLNNYLASAA
jgi:hypothetical protein